MHIHFKCVVKIHINLPYNNVANNFPTYKFNNIGMINGLIELIKQITYEML
jgi:hypothetical protein